MKIVSLYRFGNTLALVSLVQLVAIWAPFVPFLAGHAVASSREISFYNVHTRESLTVVYRRDGGYDPRAMERIDHFLRDWRRNERVRIDPRLIDLAYEVHARSGSKEAIHVLSGYRSTHTNDALRRGGAQTSKHSQHILGRALDMYIPDVPAKIVRKIALKLEGGGVGYYPQDGSGFVHLDIGRVRHWPRMPRRELAALFPQGNTNHIPADGVPLQPRSPVHLTQDSPPSRLAGRPPEPILQPVSFAAHQDPIPLPEIRHPTPGRPNLPLPFVPIQTRQQPPRQDAPHPFPIPVLQPPLSARETPEIRITQTASLQRSPSAPQSIMAGFPVSVAQFAVMSPPKSGNLDPVLVPADEQAPPERGIRAERAKLTNTPHIDHNPPFPG